MSISEQSVAKPNPPVETGSDAKRLLEAENSRDKALEDTFPASDPPTTTARISWRQRKEWVKTQTLKNKRESDKADSGIV